MTTRPQSNIRGLRWYIVAMLALASELNYLDRQTLSVLAQTIQDELAFTTIQYSYITSAFLTSYTVMYLVSGRLVDWLGSRRSFSFFVSGWSVATMLHFFARTPFQFATCRFLLGATEPANFPAGIKSVTEWFPMRERALAVGIFNAGTAVGAGLAAPVVSLIALTLGWRWAFVISGGLGFLWVIVWRILYHAPQDHPRLSPEERTLILDGAPANQPAVPMMPWSKILRLRATWACVIARMLTDPGTGVQPRRYRQVQLDPVCRSRTWQHRRRPRAQPPRAARLDRRSCPQIHDVARFSRHACALFFHCAITCAGAGTHLHQPRHVFPRGVGQHHSACRASSP
jgi:ACS family hexuronate transporter-like MFS transporter